jgi:truncated hemoglobin YjbI
VPKMMDFKHCRFFKQGLNETHFDRVARHLVATLSDLYGLDETHFDQVAGHSVATLDYLQVRKDYIAEIVGIACGSSSRGF